jgi:glucose/arabinose dehydrogenase
MFTKLMLKCCIAAGLLVSALTAHAVITPPGFANITLATGFTNASVFAVAPDGRIFVGQQAGLVRVIKNSTLLPTPFVSVQTNPTNNQNNESGILGLTFDPGFGSNNFVYVSYTATNVVPGAFVQRISRFTANGDTALAGSEFVLLETDSFTANGEIGGALRFGADGMLYIGIGQCGTAANSQSLANLFGKILRINKDGTIPASNPFFGTATGKNRAIWALGFRNPFQFAIQPGTGRIFENDVGSTSTADREEINDVIAGLNYGWPTCEGPCNPTNASFRDPIYSYGRGSGDNATVITGGTFYNPPQPLFPTQYVGQYFFADWTAAWIKTLNPITRTVSPFATNISGATDLQVGPDGALYYLMRNSGTNYGVIGKILYGVTPLVPFGSAWKYLDDGTTNIAANWTQTSFNDNNWSNGVAQLGWGNNGEVTGVRSNRTDTSRIITTYFRKSFVLSNSAPYSNYVVGFVRDDGGAVYINGTEVLRNNMPTGPLTSATFASLSVAGLNSVDERVAYAAVVNPTLLINGTNLIAAEVHQNATNAATDMSFNCALFGIDGTATLRAFLDGSGVVLAYPSWAGRFTLEAATNVPAASWNPITNTPATVGNELRVNLNATGPSNRFFRLRSP